MRSFLILVISALLVSCAPPKLKAVPGDLVAESPRMQVGDKWKLDVRRRGEVLEKTVVEVMEDGNFRLKIAHDKSKALYALCDKNHQVLGQDGQAPDSNLWNNSNYVDFPLFIGKTYSRTITAKSIIRGTMEDYRFDFKVDRVEREKFLDKDIHVFEIKFVITRLPSGGWSNTGVVSYSPELKNIIRFTPHWRGDADLMAFQVAPGLLNKVLPDGALTNVAGKDGQVSGLYSFGYESSLEDLVAQQKILEEERSRIIKERAKAEELKAEKLAEIDALRAKKLAEAEALKVEKLAEIEALKDKKLADAERLVKEKIAAATAVEEQARQLLQEQQAAAREKPQNAAASSVAKQRAAQESIKEDNRYSIAVIIGNRNYAQNNPDVPNVDYAHNDAEAIYRFVKDTLGYKVGNIIFLKDATQASLASVFGNERTHRGRLFNWVQPGKSKVFVYYSGHGAPGLSDGTSYLLPVNADPVAVELNGYPLTTLYANLAKIPARQMTVVLDACFSGSSAKGNLVQNASSIALRRVKTDSMLENGAVLTASDVSEVASWDKERKMGLFTANFIDGITGAADLSEFGDGDGLVSLGELKRFLKQKVSYQARRNYYREQNPQVVGDERLVLNYLGED